MPPSTSFASPREGSGEFAEVGALCRLSRGCEQAGGAELHGLTLACVFVHLGVDVLVVAGST